MRTTLTPGEARLIIAIIRARLKEVDQGREADRLRDKLSAARTALRTAPLQESTMARLLALAFACAPQDLKDRGRPR